MAGKRARLAATLARVILIIGPHVAIIDIAALDRVACVPRPTTRRLAAIPVTARPTLATPVDGLIAVVTARVSSGSGITGSGIRTAAAIASAAAASAAAILTIAGGAVAVAIAAMVVVALQIDALAIT